MSRKNLGVAALAIAASSCALAQASSVQIYGVVDMAYVYVDNVNGGRLKAVNSGRLMSSRLGFRGTEDLGRGMSAIYALESGIEADVGTMTSPVHFNRQSWVGLRSKDWGTVTFGRQYNPLYDRLVLLSGPPTFGLVAGAVDGIAIPGSAVGRFDNTIGGSASRSDNSIKYSSPKIGGFTLSALTGFGEVIGADSAGRTTSFALTYENGPLTAALTQFRRNCAAATGCTQAQGVNKVWATGITYEFGVANVAAIYTQQRNAKNVKDADADVFSIRATVPAGNWKFLAGYQLQNDRTQVDQDVRQLNLGANYSLSKRTLFYGNYSRQRVSNGGIASMAMLNSSNSKQAQLSLGIRHSF